MYLYPIFLGEKCDQKIINIVCEHMNEAASVAISYLIDMSEDLRRPEASKKEKKEAREFLNSFFPEQLKGKEKLPILNYIFERLESPVLSDLMDEYVYIIYRALSFYYEGKTKYSIEKKENEEENIFRIQDEEKRNLVINYFKENMDELSSEFSEDNNDKDWLFNYLMESIENINEYENTLMLLADDEDFLDFLPISN